MQIMIFYSVSDGTLWFDGIIKTVMAEFDGKFEWASLYNPGDTERVISYTVANKEIADKIDAELNLRTARKDWRFVSVNPV